MTNIIGSNSLTFAVRRHAPELIAPATPIPRELKLLSDIDDQEGLWYPFPLLFLYPGNPKMGDTNPASVIRDALPKLLVFYYPLAGRIVKGSGKKLMVDCTGEGVLFIEAEADVTLEQFGKTLCPPIPCVEKLMCVDPGSDDIVGSPLIQIQVTRLLCGGFIFTARVCHVLCDGTGAAQFLTALGEMTRGAGVPSILPVWQRELLCARDPPCITFPHPEYDNVTDPKVNHKIAPDEMSATTLFFGPSEMSSLRRFVPENLKACTNFEVLTASLWRCRTIAQQVDPEQDVHLMFFVNSRGKFNPPIPVGYYGNCIVLPCVASRAGDLCNKPLGYALELVMKGKSMVTEEYVRSTMDLMVVKGQPCHKTRSTYIVTNVSRVGFNRVNFGWGEPLFAGFPSDDEDFPGVYCSILHSTNDKGESGVLAVFGLPTPTMERLIKELDIMLKFKELESGVTRTRAKTVKEKELEHERYEEIKSRK
ncbi:benzyl alcohol O-benzoyltransferase-like [Bidens hawaiensis]|uniref:benzyl alcohol O-benzoyltransferase-like n=1 Tax=Bidens hawaiensis TaxID=980011 RepID=UPI0040495304